MAFDQKNEERERVSKEKEGSRREIKGENSTNFQESIFVFLFYFFYFYLFYFSWDKELRQRNGCLRQGCGIIGD